jgi:hypothetical protein
MRPSRTIAALALGSVLAASACGGGGDTQTGSKRAIPRSIADRLAAMSESVASSWTAGDECGAAQQADELRHATDAAISSGAIPAPYRGDLEAAVVNLQNTANCPPPPAPAEPEDNGKSEDEKKDKGKEKGHEKHQERVTVETGTSTEGND